MSEKHLAKGSVEPPRVEGLLRLYSMRFCPYAQRPRLVLKAKGIQQYDIVNIDLAEKPEWYFKIHPEGKVPALLDGDKIIIESLDISDYLDEKYPKNPLYPKDPQKKALDKEIISKIGDVTGVFGKCMYGKSDDKTPEEWWQEFLGPLQVFEDELAKRGTTFFGGDKPGMVDYMLWPFGERADVVCLKLGTELPINEDQVPLMRKWKKAMLKHPVCAEIYTKPEVFWKLTQRRLKGEPLNYDEL